VRVTSVFQEMVDVREAEDENVHTPEIVETEAGSFSGRVCHAMRVLCACVGVLCLMCLLCVLCILCAVCVLLVRDGLFF
jgi:hypothetical protein